MNDAMDFNGFWVEMVLFNIHFKSLYDSDFIFFNADRSNTKQSIYLVIKSSGFGVQNDKSWGLYRFFTLFMKMTFIIIPILRKGFFVEKPIHYRKLVKLNFNLMYSWTLESVLKQRFSFSFSSLVKAPSSMKRPLSLWSSPCLVRNFNKALVA